MSELEHCPFCGGLAKTEVKIIKMGGDDDQIDFGCICSSCGVRRTVSLNFPYTCSFADIVKAMENAAVWWNMRALDKEDSNEP